MRVRLTYANVMATIAVFIALGGTSYAISKLPKNSVGTKQLKKNAVTGAKVKDRALTGTDIVESTLGVVPSASHAKTADSATLAGRALDAEHSASAERALEAERLGGATASSYAKVQLEPVHVIGADGLHDA